MTSATVPAPGRTRRRLGAVLAVGVLGGLAWSQRADLESAGRAARTAAPGWLAVLAVGLVAWWAAWTVVHGGSLRSAGAALTRRDLPELVRGVLAAVALNSALKSGGTAGLAPMSRAGRRMRLPRATVQQGYLLAVSAADLGFLLVVAAGLLVLLVHGPLTALTAVAAGAFALLTVARVAVLVLALRHRGLVERVWTAATRARDRVLRRPHRPPDPEHVTELVDGVRRLTARPSAAVVPVLGAAAVDAAGVLMLWAAVAAVGGGDRPVAALAGYLLGSLAAVLGPLPGGLGLTEAGTLATLVAGGVPTGAAVAATLLFRLAEFWVPLLVGGLVWGTRRRADASREGTA